MSLYRGQTATPVVDNVPFYRFKNLIAVGKKGEFDSNPIDVARRNDLLPAIETRVWREGDLDTDFGRIVVDPESKTLAIIGDNLSATDLEANRRRCRTGEAVGALNPDYSIDLGLRNVGGSPERC